MKDNVEERDLLEEMFECYFRYRKMNSELPEERLIDAISGALSGADYPKVVRSDLLKNLISDCDWIKEAVRKALSIREQLSSSKTIVAPEVFVEAHHTTDTDWLNLEEVCDYFKLSKANIKDKQWRDKKDFPFHQSSTGGKVTFHRKEVEKWISERKH